MSRRKFLLTSLIFIGATSALSRAGLGDPPVQSIIPPPTALPSQTQKTTLVREMARLPLSFESNQGQTDAIVRFLTHSGDSSLFLTPSEAVFTMPVQLPLQSKEQASQQKRKPRPVAEKISHVVLRMQMVGANPKATPLQQQPLPGRVNYFIGKDPSRWHTGVPTFGRVGFHGVYPGVDLVYYGNQKHLEYDFIVAPHADPKQIQLHFAGAQGVRIDAAGDLVVRTQGRELKWRKPAVYQQNASGKHAVAAHFQRKELPQGQTVIGFALGRYDTARPVVIDPVLLYSTYLGGTAASDDADQANAIVVDSSGSAYVAGFASSTNFPVTAGAFQPVNHAPSLSDAFVTKLNSSGTALVYSTYLGGSGSGAQAKGLAIDSSGNAYVTGWAMSTDFPTTSGAFQPIGTTSFNGFVTELNSTGTALLYSTYLGGTTTIAQSIAVDSSGNAYVTGQTTSTTFPTTPGAFQVVKKSTEDFIAFVTKLNSTGTALVYSTYLGGSIGTPGDTGSGIALDSSGNAYVTGWSNSTDFPTTPGAFQQTLKAVSSGTNAFVTKLNPTGTALIYSTYLGGSSSEGDNGRGIALDGSGNAYIVGVTWSTDFPITPGAFQQTNKGGTSTPNAFVTQLNATGTALVYSTYLGGSGSKNGDGGYGIALDAANNAYIAGFTTSTDFPTTVGAFQRLLAGTGAAFVTKLNPSGTALLYSTFLGGSGNDGASSIALDSGSNVYVVGGASSTNFPITSGAFQTNNHAAAGGTNSFVTKLSAIPTFPDFNNDGFTDLLIQNATTNVIASWFMKGANWTGGAYFSQTPPSDYALVGVGDFSGNGASTLVLQSSITNQIAFWYTSGTNNATIPGGNFVNTTPQAGWKVVGVGDFNGDGKSDLVLQNQTSNQVAIWFMNGPNYQGGVLMPYTPPTGWTVAGVGDFNADGFPDIAFQNQTTGQIALWYMNGPTYAGGTVLTTVPASGWKVVGVGDYNGDGSADLLLQNQTSNQAVVWYLKNGAYLGGAVLSLTPPSGWKIVGPR